MLRYSLFPEVRNGGIGALDLKLRCCDLKDVLKKSEIRLVEAYCWVSFATHPILRKILDLFLLLCTPVTEELKPLGDPLAVFDDQLTFLDFLG